MTDTERELERALAELFAAIEAAPPSEAAAPRPALAVALERVEQAGLTLAPDAPAPLRHYVQQRSYRKALEFLRARGSTPGYSP